MKKCLLYLRKKGGYYCKLYALLAMFNAIFVTAVVEEGIPYCIGLTIKMCVPMMIAFVMYWGVVAVYCAVKK